MVFRRLDCFGDKQRLKGVVIIALFLIVTVLVSECQPIPEPAESSTDLSLAAEATAADVNDEGETEIKSTHEQVMASERESVAYGYTYHRPDGNRFVDGKGDITAMETMDINLTGKPEWLVAAPYDDGAVWVAVLEDGRVEGYFLRGKISEKISIAPDRLPVGMPPVLVVDGNMIRLLDNPVDEASNLTHPVPLEDDINRVAFVGMDGQVVLWDGEEVGKGIPKPIPDARILSIGQGRLLYFSDGTGRYDHGVLGDGVEAGGFAIIDGYAGGETITHLVLNPPSVFEGIMPIWADLDGDGKKEIIVTQSDASSGAKVVVYKDDGSLIAEGPTVGSGYRWRHQLAVAPFGSSGELELAVVRTPHISGILEFYRLEGKKLVIAATIAGFSTHRIGSRNLDNAMVGDLDGDGRIELLLPDQAHSSLICVRRTEIGVEIAWTLELKGIRTTNLAAVTLKDGRIGVGVGTDANMIRLWLP